VEHDHVVVDEAQDLSAVEVLPLLASTGTRKSLTLAGDVVQKVVFDNGYDDWEELEDQLGIRALNVEPLRLSYRSTAEVVAFAREVLGPLAPKEAPKAVRSGAPIECFSFADQGEEIAFLADNLRALMAREPQANVALLARYPERARFYANMLQEAEVPRLRLVLGNHGDSKQPADDFSFAPGIDVTNLARVKGLEYDYVILVEVTEAMYPDQVAARHLLHIGATRAAHQLWITTLSANPSPLLPAALLKDSLY
jgi:DNA helicase-2/ATP-dependent DNA helicase PcrA